MMTQAINDPNPPWMEKTARRDLEGYASRIPGFDSSLVGEFLGGGGEGYVFGYGDKALKITNDPRCDWSDVNYYLRYFQEHHEVKQVVKVYDFGKFHSKAWWQLLEKLERLDEEEEMELNNGTDEIRYWNKKAKKKLLLKQLPEEYEIDIRRKEFLAGILELPFIYDDLMGFNVMKDPTTGIWKVVDLEGFVP